MPKHLASKYRFPWREGNQFRLLVDGDRFYPAMLEAITIAKHSIILEMYLVRPGSVFDRFTTALQLAAKRGVQVFILFDDYGSRELRQIDRQQLAHPNIRLTWYNPFHYGQLRRALLRDHRKLLVVDNRIAYVGGAGLTDDFIQPHHRWHDMMIEIQGPCVSDWQSLFRDAWPAASPPESAAPIPVAMPIDAAIGAQLGRVTLSQLSNRQEIQRSLVHRIRSAEHWVWLSTAYFVPSWKLRRALSSAAKRGIDVRLVLPGPHTDHPAIRHAGRRFYYGLLRRGVRIYEYLPRFNHTKLYLCDHWISIGSSNVDRWNLFWNLEANQEVDDQTLSEEARNHFNEDFTHCLEITLEHWQRRAWHRRLLEQFWGWVDARLNQLSQRWRRKS
ncbi:MAG: phosphatidylserine/phosphatidylglycerophosphate/cardiolipin synthase family protein [Gammaproteobacteria bacterium]|nr:phosphatidylserine/phosphatidylglycerophosphate/cardiolipin synthase family protein [Gammaproteobacteria bacterium]